MQVVKRFFSYNEQGGNEDLNFSAPRYRRSEWHEKNSVCQVAESADSAAGRFFLSEKILCGT